MRNHWRVVGAVVAMFASAAWGFAQDGDAAEGPPPSEQAPEMAKFEGPTRFELFGTFEQRVQYAIEGAPINIQPSTRVQLRLLGEKLPTLARIGSAIVLEAIDDLGNNLRRNPDPREDSGERTKAFTVSGGLLRTGHLPIEVNLSPSSRTATKLTRLKGFLNVAYSSKTEELTIRNPRAFIGRSLAHPRLTELGVEVEMIEPTPEETGGEGKGVGVRIRSGADLVRGFEIYDADLRLVATRSSNRKAIDQEPYIVISTGGVTLTEDHSIVALLNPDIQTEKVEFDLKDVPLP